MPTIFAFDGPKTYTPFLESFCSELEATATERDRKGGTPKPERDRLRRSGLLKLVVPTRCGGLEECWTTTLKLVRAIAKVDASIAHLFSYHHLGVVIPYLLGTLEQGDRYFRETTANDWFWANAMNPRDRRVRIVRRNGAYELNGKKSFCSGSVDCDMLPVTAVDESEQFRVVALPSRREGVSINDDWDCMGQRQTDSGSVEFVHVRVDEQEILGPPDEPYRVFGTLRPLINQLTFSNIYLGIAQGAFESAVAFTRGKKTPWFDSGVKKFTDDPLILRRTGEMLAKLQSVTCLMDHAGARLQAAWERNKDLTEQERGECAVTISAAKVASTDTALEVTNRIFDVMGTRSTLGAYRFDRFWRNVRTFTLHDPVDYKLTDLGRWAIHGKHPEPGYYT